MLLSICIATFKRPGLLKILLESLKNQILDKEISLEILIVDNDKNETARKVVEEFKNNERIKYVYMVQPEKNISLTRNLAVAKVNGEYLLFIDDDEYASKNWVMELFRTSIATLASNALFTFLVLLGVWIALLAKRKDN